MEKKTGAMKCHGKIKIMRIIETYGEFFKHDNSKVWIVGIPSGESFEVTRKMIDTLFDQKLIYYSTQFVSTGFYAFLDKNVDEIKKIIGLEEDSKPTTITFKPKGKEVTIEKNYFPVSLTSAIKVLIDEYEGDIELFVQDDTMGITHGEYYLEVVITPEGDGFQLKQYHRSDLIDQYYATTDAKLLIAIQGSIHVYD
jgi:hypothetical protein